MLGRTPEAVTVESSCRNIGGRSHGACGICRLGNSKVSWSCEISVRGVWTEACNIETEEFRLLLDGGCVER